MNAELITLGLSNFTGTESYFRHTNRTLLTDGTQYLASTAQCSCVYAYGDCMLRAAPFNCRLRACYVLSQ